MEKRKSTYFKYFSLFFAMIVLVLFAGCSGTTPATPIINSFSATPTSITVGGSSDLSWSVTDATTVTINQSVGSVASTGTTAVTPATTTTYTLTATNASGSVTATATITVNPVTTAPTINSFSALPSTITVGESSNLSWSVTDAITVIIDQSVGSVASTGTTAVSPTTSTTYTLTATNAAGSVTASVTVVVTTVPPAEHTVTLKPNVDESGYVRDTGQMTPKYMYVGDDANNISLQAFMSFDISGIPAGGIISSVVVDFSDHDTIYGDPFSSLGCLRAYPHDYGTLDGGDYFTGSPLGAVIRYCLASEIVAGSDPNVAIALQAKVGSSRFQMRLQFNDSETNNDLHNDLVCWTSAHLPELVVTYSTP
jgi:hypothetical protein